MATPTKRDILTPANAVTIAGFLVAAAGALHLDTIGGLVTVVIGRSFDMVDGPIARRTHASHFGSILDATADKIAGLILLIAAYHFKLAPVLFLVLVFLYHLAISVINFFTEKQGTPARHLIAGKQTMFLHVSALVLFVWSTFASGNLHTWLRTLAVIVAVASIWFAIKSVSGYFDLYRKSAAKTHK